MICVSQLVDIVQQQSYGIVAITETRGDDSHNWVLQELAGNSSGGADKEGEVLG